MVSERDIVGLWYQIYECEYVRDTLMGVLATLSAGLLQTKIIQAVSNGVRRRVT